MIDQRDLAKIIAESIEKCRDTLEGSPVEAVPFLQGQIAAYRVVLKALQPQKSGDGDVQPDTYAT
jgi:hypothetical protein